MSNQGNTSWTSCYQGWSISRSWTCTTAYPPQYYPSTGPGFHYPRQDGPPPPCPKPDPAPSPIPGPPPPRFPLMAVTGEQQATSFVGGFNKQGRTSTNHGRKKNTICKFYKWKPPKKPEEGILPKWINIRTWVTPLKRRLTDITKYLPEPEEIVATIAVKDILHTDIGQKNKYAFQAALQGDIKDSEASVSGGRTRATSSRPRPGPKELQTNHDVIDMDISPEPEKGKPQSAPVNPRKTRWGPVQLTTQSRADDTSQTKSSFQRIDLRKPSYCNEENEDLSEDEVYDIVLGTPDQSDPTSPEIPTLEKSAQLPRASDDNEGRDDVAAEDDNDGEQQTKEAVFEDEQTPEDATRNDEIHQLGLLKHNPEMESSTCNSDPHQNVKTRAQSQSSGGGKAAGSPVLHDYEYDDLTTLCCSSDITPGTDVTCTYSDYNLYSDLDLSKGDEEADGGESGVTSGDHLFLSPQSPLRQQLTVLESQPLAKLPLLKYFMASKSHDEIFDEHVLGDEDERTGESDTVSCKDLSCNSENIELREILVEEDDLQDEEYTCKTNPSESDNPNNDVATPAEESVPSCVAKELPKQPVLSFKFVTQLYEEDEELDYDETGLEDD